MKLRALATLVVLLSGVLLHGYSTIGGRWGTTSVPYFVNPQSKWVSSNAATSALQTAAAGWRNQTRANIALVYSGTTNGSSLALNNKNEVFFRSDGDGTVAETYVWFDGSGRLVDGDMVLHEGAYQFFAQSGCAGGVYVEDVAIHEFGHLLGLGHSDVAGATMQAAMPGYCDTTQLTLEADDISGIESLYPPSGGGSSGNTAPSLTVSSPANNASFIDTALISFVASASDTQDGNLTGSIRWTSNLLPGTTLGTGGSFARTLPPGTHILTATVTDRGNLSASKTVTVVVTASAQASASGATLAARGYKARGRDAVDLSWTGLSGASVDVFRNGARLSSSQNSGTMTDNIGTRGGGTFTYQVCVAGSTTCTNKASVTF